MKAMILASLLIAACKTETANPPASGNATTQDISAAPDAASGNAASPLILYPADPKGAYHQARIEGVLVRDGGCVYLGDADFRTLLAFPTPTTRWDAASGTIKFGDQTLRFGERMAFGGSGGESGTAALPPGAASSVCDHSRTWNVSPEPAQILQRQD